MLVLQTYPLQKKRLGFELLRDYSHLRMRTNTFSAVMRVRNRAQMALHEWFQVCLAESRDENCAAVLAPIFK
jgi:aspartyl/asparaginyl-tRNA synthetase